MCRQRGSPHCKYNMLMVMKALGIKLRRKVLKNFFPYVVVILLIVTCLVFNITAAVLSAVVSLTRNIDFRLENFDGYPAISAPPFGQNYSTGKEIFPAKNGSHRSWKFLNGGRFLTSKPRHEVAIIMPFRNRESQLLTLLRHMHPIWQRQDIDYTVFVVNQAGDGLFNKGKLMNIGVSEVLKDKEYDCFVFHDTDLLLEDDKCLYWCDNDNPRHLARHVDVFSYEPVWYRMMCMPTKFSLGYVELFGGVTAFTKKQFKDVNGFSTLYWGWGGEDDDMYMRLWNKGYSPTNPYGRACSYRMVKHEHESENAANPARNAILYHSVSRADQEGYNTLRYKVLSVEKTPLYTNITVDVGRPSKRMKEFMSQTFGWWTTCSRTMPWYI